MGGIPTVSFEAFERWPERLRATGYEVEIRDEELGIGAVRKGWREVEVAFPRCKDGTSLMFIKGWCWRRGKFVKQFVAIMETPLQGDRL